GYGGLGVIVQATLELTENQRVARAVRKLPVTEYRDFFFSEVRASPAVFHNGDLYPPAYDTVTAITWFATDRPVTVADRLMPVRDPNWADRLALFGVSEMPFGKELRARVLDPLKLRDHPVVWRNYEASYDVRQLEPRSRARSYYLPYQIHATEAQFRRAYPRAAEFFALKSRVDPDYRFRNKLWDRYDPPPKPATAAGRSAEWKLRSLKNYARSEDQTYLTLPEW